MAVAEIEVSAAPYVVGSNSNYATARITSSAFLSGATNLIVGQEKSLFAYSIRRPFLKFDTSSLSGETINQVQLRLTLYADASDLNDFDVQIVKQDWSAQDPITNDTREAAYDGCLAGTADSSIWRNTSGIATDTPYESGNLDTTWVNTSGYTYYSLISSRDKNSESPGTSSGGEYIYLHHISSATAAYRPILVVTYGEAPPASSTPIHLIRTGMQPGMRIGL